jgi:ABC-type Fe2+-enterobactin transport system substrate-binding protein
MYILEVLKKLSDFIENLLKSKEVKILEKLIAENPELVTKAMSKAGVSFPANPTVQAIATIILVHLKDKGWSTELGDLNETLNCFINTAGKKNK